MDLHTLCLKVEAAVPTARATAIPEINQVIVTFTNRPDVEIALLTPVQQKELSITHAIADDDISLLLFSIRRIAANN